MGIKKVGKGIDFNQPINKAKRAKIAALNAIANNSVYFFKVTTFDAQAWIDTTVNRWAPRKNQTDRPGRKILVDTGAGRQSIHTHTVTTNRVVIRAEAEYMNYHNTGTKNMPQRKFMGQSAKLDAQNKAILERYFKKVL